MQPIGEEFVIGKAMLSALRNLGGAIDQDRLGMAARHSGTPGRSRTGGQRQAIEIVRRCVMPKRFVPVPRVFQQPGQAEMTFRETRLTLQQAPIHFFGAPGRSSRRGGPHKLAGECLAFRPQLPRGRNERFGSNPTSLLGGITRTTCALIHSQ